MSAIGSEFNPATATNSNQFQHYTDSLFTASNVEQHQFAVCSAQFQQLQSQQHQQQILLQQQPSNSSSVSPTPNCFSSDNLTNSFSQSTPEKNSLSQSPPSPADSGVVTDAKSDGGNISQESLQTIDQHKLEDSLDFPTGSKSPITGASFGATISSSYDNQNNYLSFQVNQALNSSNSFNSLNGLKNNYSSDLGLGLSNTDDLENSVSIPPDLASIWSSPALPNSESPISANNSTMEEAVLQAALQQQQQQQQQQQLGGWPSNLSGLTNSGLTNPPPGLGHSAMLQKQLQQQNTAAQIQAMQQQLALRRSQSTVMTQANAFNRSTSHQPGLMGGMGSLNSAKLNGSLNPKQSPYSSWSNGQVSGVNQWPTSSRSLSLFNSLQHSTSSSSRLLNGSNALRKQSLSSQMLPPPRLNRSISTPAKYSSYMNGSGMPGTLDDNPFFKVADPSNGLLSMTDNADTIGFSNWESPLYDVMRSSDNSALSRATAGIFGKRRGKWTDMNSDILFEDNNFGSLGPGLGGNMASMLGEYPRDRYSRKVFVGGLPPDIDEEEIQASFRQFGPLVVDWPHKAESKSYFPPKGYAFLLFQEELSVQNLMSCCLKDGDKLYIRVSSPTIREKPVQIRPWNLSDSDFVLDGSQPLDPRKTIFVGGVPRPLRAVELAMIMDRLYGGVCYAGIDVDPDLKYPKGAGRVAFSNQQSYIAAISARFVQLQHGDIDKRVEVKPYVLDDQHCDICQGSRCGGKFAPFFCANVACLQYYCEHCWSVIHARPGREFHKPLVKEGADRSSRSMNFRW